MTENMPSQDADVQQIDAAAEEKTAKTRKIAKMILIGVILFAVAGVWFAKRSVVADEVAMQAATATENAEQNGDTQADSSEEDFALEAESIDLAALLAYQLPIVIDFGSDSCIPCQEMAPVLKSVNAESQGKAIIKFVDVWKYTDAADHFPVQVIPTQVLIGADGKPYVPGKDFGIEFNFYYANGTSQHVFTTHQGALTGEQLRAILADMGAEE